MKLLGVWLLVVILAYGALKGTCLGGYLVKKILHGSDEKRVHETLPCIVKNLEAKTDSKLMLCIWSVFADSQMVLAGYDGSLCVGCSETGSASLRVRDFNGTLYFKQGRPTFFMKCMAQVLNNTLRK